MALLHTIKNWICPHCNVEADHSVLYAAVERRKNKRPIPGRSVWEENPERIQAFASCGQCNQPSVFVLKPKTTVQHPAPITSNAHHHLMFLNRLRPLEVLYDGSSSQRGERRMTLSDASMGHPLNSIYEIVDHYPKTAIQRPESELLPETVNKVFDEMQHQMSQPRYLVIACRRMLEMTCKERLGDNKGNLADKIDRLQANGLITEDMKGWAHTLRGIMNESTHDEDEPSIEKARELYDFCRLLADLLYVYPRRIERLRSAE